MAPVREETDDAAAVRRVLREIRAALALCAVLLAMVLASVVAHDRAVAAIVAAVALAAVLAVGVVVARRAASIAQMRNATFEEERAGRERLDRTLAASRRFLEAGSSAELQRQICTVALEVFECAAVSLWAVEPETLRLLDRVPMVAPYRAGERRTITDLPGLREAFDTAQPLFVSDLRTQATGPTQATAEILGTGSLLNVPVAVGGVTQLSLVLSWTEVVPAPSPGQRIAAQRFVDQAGLALEQARYRAAQAEVEALNLTLSRMVQANPLFRADGSVTDVGEAICRGALDVFEASGAALWIEVEGGIELVGRVPEVTVFDARQQILFAEHPTFRQDLETGDPRFVADVEQDDPVLWERFARHSGSRSQLRLPLASAGRARALIVLSWARVAAPHSPAVAAIASRFADQAGAALAEAARREAARDADELHASFEQSLLPTIELDAPDAGVATFYRAGDERLTLGGDFFDCLELEDGSIVALVGDVAGHGPAAAALGAGLRSAWRALVLGGWRLEQIPGGLQAVCVRERRDPYMFVTAICAVVAADRSDLRFVSAGHPAPLVTGVNIERAANGPPLGVVTDAVWEPTTVPLPPSATVLLYTDGLVEGREQPEAAERLGVEPIEALLAEATPGEVDGDFLSGLVDVATAANGTGLPDDVALLALNLRRRC